MYKTRQKKHWYSRLKDPKILVALTILLVGLVFGVKYYQNHHKSKVTEINTADGQKVDLSPATADDKAQTDSNKEQIVNDSSKPTTPTGTKSSNVIVSSYSSTGLSAYVTGVFEDGGTCTATATSGSTTITKSSVGFKNVSYTQCVPINWETPLSSGVWSVKVTYKSSSTESSSTVSLEVK